MNGFSTLGRRPGRGSGASLKADKATFPTSAAQGALIASLSSPFGGGETFTVIGTLPGQLALSGATILKGATAAVAGFGYTGIIRAAKGGRAIEEPLTFTAAGAVVAPTVAFSAAVSQAEGNSGTTAFVYTLTLTRNGSTAAFPFTWAVTGSGSNPSSAADFGGTFPSGSGTFASGETTKTMTVLASGDTAVEPDEAFLLTATVTGIGDATVQGTILNDDAAVPPVISISSPSISEGNSGTAQLAFAVTLDKTSASAVTVAYATSNGTATAGTDYTATSGTLTIAAGQTSGTINVPVLGDTTVESSETVVMTLSSPTNATLGGDGSTLVGTGTITNDDAGGTPYSVPAIFTNGSFLVNLVGNPVSQSIAGPFSTNYSAATFKDVGTTYYVRAAGNDTTGDGLSAGTAWRTIQKAHDTIPAGSIINVGAGRFPNFVQTKSLSIIGVPTATFVGDMLTNADVSAWGALTSGRQTVTLTTGAVSGFVDLTKTKVFPTTAVSSYQVSKVQSTAAAIATTQAAGNPGVFRSTPSTIGASDARDLTGSADTNIIMWKATALPAFTLTGAGVKLYAYGLTFVGGSESIASTATQYVLESCEFLGGVGQLLQNNSSKGHLQNLKVRGCSLDGADLIDYSAGSQYGSEFNVIGDQGGGGGSDQISTAHGSFILRVNGVYLESNQTVYDVGDAITGMFGSTVGGALSSVSIGNGSTMRSELHASGLTFVGSASSGDIKGSPGSHIFFYDKSYVGRSLEAATLPINDRTGSKPTADAILVYFNPGKISTLFKDAAGTIPVTADGDIPLRINSDVPGSADYWTFPGGTYIYRTDGTKGWLVPNVGANLGRILFKSIVPLEDGVNFHVGLSSTDVAWSLFGNGASAYFGDYRNGQTVLTKTPFIANSGFEHHVDNSPTNLTTGTAINTAVATGTPHVLTVRNLNMSWVGFLNVYYMGSAATAISQDGSIYGFMITRATAAASIRAYDQIIATAAGATLV